MHFHSNPRDDLLLGYATESDSECETPPEHNFTPANNPPRANNSASSTKSGTEAKARKLSNNSAQGGEFKPTHLLISLLALFVAYMAISKVVNCSTTAVSCLHGEDTVSTATTLTVPTTTPAPTMDAAMKALEDKLDFLLQMHIDQTRSSFLGPSTPPTTGPTT